MTERHLEQLLRETVQHLATEGRPVDLAAPALRTARRVRMRRAVSAAAGVLIVIAGFAFAVTRGVGTDRSEPPAEPSTSASTAGTPTREPSSEPSDVGTAPVLLPGGWLIRGAPTADDRDLVLYDDQRSRYRLMVNGGPTVPSPNGRYLATVDRNRQLKVTSFPEGQEIYDGGSVVETVRPVWSPDGSRVAFVMINADGTKVRTSRVADGVETTSGAIQCPNGCTLKWLEDGQRIRVYAGNTYRVEVGVANGAVGAPSATPDDPCGRQVLAYRIDSESWLCVTQTGFAVTTNAGAVTQRVPFPTQLDGVPVKAGDTHWYLFRPK